MGAIVSRVLLCAAVFISCAAWSADVVMLAPGNYEEFAPAGKETDAIYGDFVLRNANVVAVIAQADPLRNANMMTRGIAGGVIDLTRRTDQSDQLGVYLPWAPYATVVFNAVEVDGVLYPAQAGYEEVLRGASVGLHFTVAPRMSELWGSREAPIIRVTYTLTDGAEHIQVDAVYENRSDEAMRFQVRDYFRMDQSKDDRAVDKTADGAHPYFWSYDPWFGQAYVVQSAGNRVNVETPRGGLAPSHLTYVSDGNADRELSPGGSLSISRRIVPGATLAGALSIARSIDGAVQHAVRIALVDESGVAVPDAKIALSGADGEAGWAHTGADGALELALPAGGYTASVSTLAQGDASITFNVPEVETAEIKLPAPGYVDARITDAAGGPIPAKVQFIGKDGTETPFFGPDSGIHGIHNCYYTHNGTFEQVLAPGTYDVIVSYGIEYDAVFTDITIEEGRATPLRATLERTVDTAGWVSADYHSHATPSGDNTSSQRGRVLNLLCEHIEFAPCTEHNRLDSYQPHMRELGIEHLMASCTGIELTSNPGGLNHHNAFPLEPRYGIQDNGAPLAALYPDVQIARLAYWDGNSDKLVQQNHPDMPNLFFDRNDDGEQDDGYENMFGYMDVIEIHPAEAIYQAPLIPSENADPTNRNRMATWLQLWNLGKGVPGVVNTDAHANFHGSGPRRNYIKSPTDDPSEIDVIDIVHASEAGQVMMTNGPYLEFHVASGNEKGGLGDTINAANGNVSAHVRVQTPNWLTVDRVDILVNGRRSNALIFTKASHPDLFKDGHVTFDHTVDIDLDGDAHIIAATIGENSTLGAVMGPSAGGRRPVAVTNPVFVDTDGNGFEPNGDTLDVTLIPPREE